MRTPAGASSGQRRSEAAVRGGTAPAGNLFVLDARLYCWLALAISLVCLYRRLALAGDIPHWISSDSLWPVNLVIDLFVDHYPLRGWQFSIAPCWFPDVVFVGMTYGVTGNAVSATIIGGFLQFGILILGFCICWRALHLPYPIIAETATLLMAIWITLYTAFHPAGGYGAFQQFYIPQSHVGNLTNLVWALALSLQLLVSRRLLSAFSYCVLCLLAAMSNVLFAVHFLLPITAAVVLLQPKHKVNRRNMLYVLAGWPAAFLGIYANRLIFTGTSVAAQSAFGWAAFKDAVFTFLQGSAAQLAVGDPLHILALVWIVACAIASVIFLTRCNTRSLQCDAIRAAFFIVGIGASLGSAAAIVVGGSGTLTTYHSYGLTLRYLHPMFFFPLFAWPVLVGLIAWPRCEPILRPVTAAVALIAMFASAIVLVKTETPRTPLRSYAPKFVRELDRYARTYHLKYGVAGYWQARLTTLLSAAGLRVYQVDRNLEPFHWVNNIEWYSQSVEDRTRPPVFNFAILHDPQMNIQAADVRAVFGDNGVELPAGDVSVFVYPERTPAVRQENCSVTQRAGVLEYTGGCLDGSTGRVVDRIWMAHEASDTAGFAVLQPAPRLRTGSYTLDIDYSASVNGGPDIAAIDISYPAQLLHSDSLRAGQDHVRFQFSVPAHRDGEIIRTRIFYTGFGDLQVRRLVVSRNAGGK